ncbi:MAG: DUF362 domain-containing protein [Bacteroidota bacterium]
MQQQKDGCPKSRTYGRRLRPVLCGVLSVLVLIGLVLDLRAAIVANAELKKAASTTSWKPFYWLGDLNAAAARFRQAHAGQTPGEGDRSTVAVVASNSPGITDPIALDKPLTLTAIREMVARAIGLVGGLEALVDQDDRVILIKPNVVEPLANGTGTNTDYRVVQALVEYLHERRPDLEFVIAEAAGGWADPSQKNHPLNNARAVDGFAVAGYRQMLAGLQQESPDLKIRLLDMNQPEADMVEVKLPYLPAGEGLALHSYRVHRQLLSADRVINVPVLKITATVTLTNALKNAVGYAPGSIYGWAKTKLPHDARILDEVIVDLNLVRRPDFTLVDATLTMEQYKSSVQGGKPVRRNLVLAGRDPVAVDAVGALLLGINPADLEQVTLAGLLGLGEADPARITVVLPAGVGPGQAAQRVEYAANDLERLGLVRPYQRYGTDVAKPTRAQQRAQYGQTNRIWILKGSTSSRATSAAAPILDEIAARAPAHQQGGPQPGRNGWSQAVYFSDDFIQPSIVLGTKPAFYYAFTRLSVEQSTPTELWIGSDGQLRVWLDGRLIYSYLGPARETALPNDRVRVQLPAGEHTLLVEVGEGRFALDFTGIPDPEQIPRPDKPAYYAGSRVNGLRYHL